MPPTVPTGEPTVLVAGDTWTWKKRHTDFPISEGWAISYSLRGTDSLPWNTAWVTNDGSEWTVTIPAASTILAPGRYEFSAHYTGSGTYAGQKFTERLEPVTVTADLRTAAAGDRVTHAEKMIPLLEVAIQKLATDGIKSYSIAGRMFTRNDLAELRRMLGQYRAEVRRQRSPGQLTQAVGVRFRRPW